MVKVSVVIPVYNVEAYLPKCLGCLLGQTLSDIELVCVNDGSSDNSLAVLRQYAAGDKRVVVIDQPNLGPGVARNNGIKVAAGEYIGFVDPDDWVDKDAFEKMYEAAKQNAADVVECGVMTHNEKSGKIKTKLNLYDGKIFSWKNNPAYLFQGVTAAWNKLCRASLLKEKNIEFSAGRCAEDHIFTVALRVSAAKVVYLNEALYHYWIHESSLTQKRSKANLEVPEFMANIAALLKAKGVYDAVYELYCKDAAGLCAIHYNKTPEENHKEYIAACEKCLPEKAFGLFKDFIRPCTLRDQIFSIRRIIKSGRIYKVLTVLGIKIKLKGARLL